MNTNELDKIYIGSNEATKLYNGSVLVWEKESQGRVFNVGTGSGNLVIDGSTIGGGLIDTDTVIVAAGTYNNIDITNINIPSGKVNIESEAVVVSGRMSIGNVVGCDIANGSFVENPSRAIEFTPGTLGNISLTDMTFSSVSDYTIAYPAGSFSGVFEGLQIIGCAFDDCLGVYLQGNVDFPNSVDNGRVSNFLMSDCSFENCDTTMLVKGDNTDNYIIRDITVLNCEDTSLSHARLFHMAGEGDIYNIKAENYYGNVAVQWPFSRNTDSNGLCRIWNIIGRNCGRYSITEIQNFDSMLESGTSSPCDCIIAHIDGIDLTGGPATFPAVCVDLYTDTFTGRNRVRVANCVTVNTNLPEGNEFRGYQFVINNVSQVWDNVDYDHNLPYNTANTDPAQHGSYPTDENPYLTYEDIGLDGIVDYKPVSGSILIGAGELIEGMELDYHGVQRSASPSIGACEPA